MLQFLFILAQSVMYTTIAIAHWTRKGEVVDAVNPFTWYNMCFIALSPPLCLMTMSKKLRKEYGTFTRCGGSFTTPVTTVTAARQSDQESQAPRRNQQQR
ncbi:hypothetical protein AAVH_23752 [Aphelenchoides avenae]|nr:hypothetical protein AAVH_23752 [Aphelenchus avenae]